MKMVAAAKLKIAQTRLEPALNYQTTTTRALKGVTAGDLSGAELTVDSKAPHLFVLVTTDRGLCGAVTSNVVRRAIEESKSKKEVEFASVGTKGQDGVAGQGRAANLGIVAAELSTKPPTYAEVCFLADYLLQKKASGVTIIYNHFINMLSNQMSIAKFISIDELRSSAKWQARARTKRIRQPRNPSQPRARTANRIRRRRRHAVVV